MSFWTKIGLADKDIVLTLQSEIIQLREEQLAISSENRKLLEEIIHLEASHVEELISKDVDDYKNENHELAEQMKNQMAELKQQVLDAEKSISNNIDEFGQKNIKKMEASVQDMIEQGAELTNILSGIQDNIKILSSNIKDNGILITSNSDKLNNLLEEMHGMIKTGSQIENICSEVSLLSESLRNLWTIMKAIWIDSVLTDIDESI